MVGVEVVASTVAEKLVHQEDEPLRNGAQLVSYNYTDLQRLVLYRGERRFKSRTQLPILIEIILIKVYVRGFAKLIVCS